MKRRTLIGAGFVVAAAGRAVALPGSQGTGPWRFFTEEEALTVDAICERLIPADDDPGARQAGVVHYIDIQLTGPFRRYQRIYREGIASVDASCRASHSKRFVELTPDEQDEVLYETEENSAEFFELVLTHTRQGFYGDPRHGGNRGRVSWKMVGLSYPPVRGRMHYDNEPKAG